jgi:hypothetical protein
LRWRVPGSPLLIDLVSLAFDVDLFRVGVMGAIPRNPDQEITVIAYRVRILVGVVNRIFPAELLFRHRGIPPSSGGLAVRGCSAGLSIG